MNINTKLPDPQDLQYFLIIARTLNLSRASERIGIGQPALSLSLKRLEHVIGTALFIRRQRGLVLTSAGLRLLRKSESLLSEWEDLIRETQNDFSELKATFRLGAHQSVALYTISSLVKDIHTQYPSITLELEHGLSREICEGVISGKIDFGFVVNPIPNPNLVIKKLAKDNFGFWKSPNCDENVLIYNPDLVQSQTLLKKEYSKFSKFLSSKSLEVIAVMAKNGVGVALLPQRVVNVLAPELTFLKEYSSYTDEITFLYHCELQKTQAVKAILEIVKKLQI